MRKIELPLDSIDSLGLKIGTFNFKDPKVFFISGCAWVTCTKKIDYAKALDEIESNMHRRIRERLSKIDCLDEKFIFDFDLTANNMKLGSAKFFKFMIFFKQNGEIRSLEKMKTLMNVTIIDGIEEMINDFQECGFRLVRK